MKFKHVKKMYIYYRFYFSVTYLCVCYFTRHTQADFKTNECEKWYDCLPYIYNILTGK